MRMRVAVVGSYLRPQVRCTCWGVGARWRGRVFVHFSVCSSCGLGVASTFLAVVPRGSERNRWCQTAYFDCTQSYHLVRACLLASTWFVVPAANSVLATG
mmetsp:Transcript_42609/g.95892  ORF Transcript_42609/g.95892 Transcript_42609/m.95892 type:complete len:100 (-) Transcript_42609:23-322(-)